MAGIGTRVRRALRRSPRYLVRRAIDSAKRRARRPWSYVYPRLMTESALIAALGARDVDQLWRDLSAQPFFISSSAQQQVVDRFMSEYPGRRAEIVAAADAVLRHEFDLLGSGPQQLGPQLPWHTDFKTGRQWPLAYCTDIEYNELDRPTDVKVPWELSRCQHFTRLGQAYWLTGDERYAEEFVAEATDWIGANPLSYGVNWACAMDVALRAVSWIWAFHFFARSRACAGAAFRSPFLRALFLHGEFIVKHLEKADLNGNHYVCDGAGLVFLGCFFRRARSARGWLALGRRIVEQEIFAQTTADGVDFEQSTAYHRLVLEAFLCSYELLRRCGESPPDACWKRLERMCEFVQAYTKPDGRAPLIGDADDGRVQILGGQPVGDHRYLLSHAAVMFDRGDCKVSAGRCWDETFWLLGADAPDRFRAVQPQMPPGSTGFADGGFYILRAPDTHVIVDCGEVGMRGRGGHGHNDMLSFELFLNGTNVVTDCGAYLYTASREWRNRFRSTAFHNTLQVDGEELNRFVAPDALWQLHYDARPVGAGCRSADRVDAFSGGHSGYMRLSPSVMHIRAFFVDRERPRVLVRDRVSGSGSHALVWRFHLDPAVTAEVKGTDVSLSGNGGTVWLLPDETAATFSLSLAPGWVSPSYGVKLPTTVLIWSATVSVPIEASYLFAESRLAIDERLAVVESLKKALPDPPAAAHSYRSAR
jgi:Heparinase II/III-like protein/Heparinase II/III N-terminus